jgi:hypothetical protein
MIESYCILVHVAVKEVYCHVLFEMIPTSMKMTILCAAESAADVVASKTMALD